MKGDYKRKAYQPCVVCFGWCEKFSLSKPLTKGLIRHGNHLANRINRIQLSLMNAARKMAKILKSTIHLPSSTNRSPLILIIFSVFLFVYLLHINGPPDK